MPHRPFPPTVLSQIPAGVVLPDDQKLYLLQNKDGAASITLVDGQGKPTTFQLGFTTLAKAQRFVDLLRQPSGALKIKAILEVEMKKYVDRPGATQVALDVDPAKLLLT